MSNAAPKSEEIARSPSPPLLHAQGKKRKPTATVEEEIDRVLEPFETAEELELLIERARKRQAQIAEQPASDVQKPKPVHVQTTPVTQSNEPAETQEEDWDAQCRRVEEELHLPAPDAWWQEIVDQRAQMVEEARLGQLSS